jgi:hypothetical protein
LLALRSFEHGFQHGDRKKDDGIKTSSGNYQKNIASNERYRDRRF